MVMLKILSVGLIATAMLTTVVSARENPRNGGYAAEHSHASVSPFAHSGAGDLRMLAPSVGGYTPELSDQPGGVCDHGDDPEIC